MRGFRVSAARKLHNKRFVNNKFNKNKWKAETFWQTQPNQSHRVCRWIYFPSRPIHRAYNSANGFQMWLRCERVVAMMSRYLLIKATIYGHAESSLRNSHHNQPNIKLTLTCDSVIPKAYASFARSGPAKYFVCSNVFSRAKICCPLNVGLVCFFLPSLSWLWCVCDKLADTGRIYNQA